MSAVRSAADAELNRLGVNGMAPADSKIPPSTALLRIPALSLEVSLTFADGFRLQQALRLSAMLLLDRLWCLRSPWKCVSLSWLPANFLKAFCACVALIRFAFRLQCCKAAFIRLLASAKCVPCIALAAAPAVSEDQQYQNGQRIVWASRRYLLKKMCGMCGRGKIKS